MSFLQSNPVKKIITNQEGDFTESEIELAQEIARLNKITNINFEIAQLRHLYKQMINGEVKDNKSAAKYLLGPVIEKLENMTNNTNKRLESL